MRSRSWGREASGPGAAPGGGGCRGPRTCLERPPGSCPSPSHQVFIGLAKIIITGELEERWTSRKIGPVVASRFTTTQVRCLRLWLSEDRPTHGLTRVVGYIIFVWAEVFILSRHKNLLTEAPRLLLLEVMLTRKFCTLPEKILLKTSISLQGGEEPGGGGDLRHQEAGAEGVGHCQWHPLLQGNQSSIC